MNGPCRQDSRKTSARGLGFGSLLSLLALTACTHGPVVHEPLPASSIRVNPAVAPGEIVMPVSPQPMGSVEVLPADEIRIAVTSEPSGARILVNNQPVGRTPLRLAVRVTAQGFCADYVTVRARFVAEDSTQVSQTVDVQLTPLEKPPATLAFTASGVQRRMN